MVTASCSYCNCFYFNYSMYFKKIPCKTSGDTNYCLSCKLTLQLALVTVMSLNDSEPTLINQLTSRWSTSCTSFSLHPVQNNPRQHYLWKVLALLSLVISQVKLQKKTEYFHYISKSISSLPLVMGSIHKPVGRVLCILMPIPHPQQFLFF